MYRLVVSPHSAVQRHWDATINVLVILSICMIPMQIAFDKWFDGTGWLVFQVSVCPMQHTANYTPLVRFRASPTRLQSSSTRCLPDLTLSPSIPLPTHQLSMDAIFIIDVMLRLFVFAYEDDGIIVRDARRIIQRHVHAAADPFAP